MDVDKIKKLIEDNPELKELLDSAHFSGFYLGQQYAKNPDYYIHYSREEQFESWINGLLK